MSTRITLKRLRGAMAAAAALASLAFAQELAPAVPRNVLVIVADDLGKLDLHCYGNPKLATPAIDHLASQGLRFERAYTPTAICQPSRSCLYTGLYPHRNGAFGIFPIRGEAATWPELLTPDHCATALIGKLHVAPPERFRFEVTALNTHADFGDERDPRTYATHLDNFLGAVGERRFCAVVSCIDPHRPFDGGAKPASAIAPADVWIPPFLIDTPELRADLAKYAAAVQRLDQCVASVLEVLATRKHAEDTLVVFTSDNGTPFPFAKTTLYEAGIGLPLIVRWPGVTEAGTTSAELVNLVDLLPTVLEVFGAASAQPLDGRSLLPLLRGDEHEQRAEMFATHEMHRRDSVFPMRSIRFDDVKYIVNFMPERIFSNSASEIGDALDSWKRAGEHDAKVAARVALWSHRPSEELYDLSADPHELVDLARSEAHAATLARARERLRQWMLANDDPRAAKLPQAK